MTSKPTQLTLFSDKSVTEVVAFLGCYATYVDSYTTFLINLAVPSCKQPVNNTSTNIRCVTM